MKTNSRSTHVDEFNHDPWAARYDQNVQNEEDPIRAGYDDVLDWTVSQAQIGATDVVVDLGIGTGNTSLRIKAAQAIIGVDISEKMMTIAKEKLSHLPVQYVTADLLEYLTDRPKKVQSQLIDAFISTYAVHHLMADEKALLFEKISNALKTGSRAVFGDLMFPSTQAQDKLTQFYKEKDEHGLVLDFDEEFFWHVDTDCRALEEAGLSVVEVTRFSMLSWGICTMKM